MLPIIIELMEKGASKVEVCAELGICTDTLYEWCKDSDKKEFSDTIKRGEDLSNAWWERNGRVNLHSTTFNSSLWYMNMKNRFKWADRQETESTVTVQTNVSDEDKAILDQWKGS